MNTKFIEILETFTQKSHRNDKSNQQFVKSGKFLDSFGIFYKNSEFRLRFT